MQAHESYEGLAHVKKLRGFFEASFLKLLSSATELPPGTAHLPGIPH